MRALQIASSGMLAQERRTEVVANNLANMNTSGYQRRRMEFSALIYKVGSRPDTQQSSAGEQNQGGVHTGLGVKAAATYRITQQGFMKSTENPLDISIQGAGYFQIQMPNGEISYTRDGNFQIGPEGQIVTQDGYPLQPGLSIPTNAQKITVNATGGVVAKIPGKLDSSNIGNFQIALFQNAGGMKAIGNNLFAATEQSGEPVIMNPGQGGGGSLLQGFVETSNVNPIEEITNLIKAHRAYDMNSKMMQTADKMMAPIGAN
jgi:flagellar basal-body rod protein FlgG